MAKYDNEWVRRENSRLMALLFQDGEPSLVARKLFREADRMTFERHREWIKARDLAKSEFDSNGKPKKRTIIQYEVVLAALALMRQEDSWADMLVELPMELAERNIVVSRNTLNKILEKYRGIIERDVARERLEMSKGPS